MPPITRAHRDAGGEIAAFPRKLEKIPQLMIASSRTLSIEETLLEPPALTPPPTRHALFIILIALATLLHVATAGSGDLYSQTEGQYAGAAREMVETHDSLVPTNESVPRLPKPTLLH